MRFKIGDKVKVVCNHTDNKFVQAAMNKIGIVVSVPCVRRGRNDETFFVQFDEDVYCGLNEVGFYEDEIKKVIVKNQQLLFNFME